MREISVAVIGGSGFLGQHIVKELLIWQDNQNKRADLKTTNVLKLSQNSSVSTKIQKILDNIDELKFSTGSESAKNGQVELDRDDAILNKNLDSLGKTKKLESKDVSADNQDLKAEYRSNSSFVYIPRTTSNSSFAKNESYMIKQVKVLDIKGFTPDVEIMDFLPVIYEYCDIRNLTEIEKCLEGVTAVIHCAAVFPDIMKNGDLKKSQTWETNVEGTCNVINACKTAKVKCLIYTSSMAAVFGGQKIISHTEPITPFIPTEKLTLGDYAKTRKLAEIRIIEANNYNGANTGCSLQTTVLRPVWLYGEGDKKLIPQFINLAKANGGTLPQIGGPLSYHQLAYVGNAAYAHICSLENLLKNNDQGNPHRECAGLVSYISDDSLVAEPNIILLPFLSPFDLKTSPPSLPYIVVLLVTYLLNAYLFILNKIFDFKRTVFGHEKVCKRVNTNQNEFKEDMTEINTYKDDGNNVTSRKRNAEFCNEKNNGSDGTSQFRRTYDEKLSSIEVPSQEDIDTMAASDISTSRQMIENETAPCEEIGETFDKSNIVPVLLQKICAPSIYVSRLRSEMTTRYRPIYNWKDSLSNSLVYYKNHLN